MTSSPLAATEMDWGCPGAGQEAFVLHTGAEQIGWLRFEKKPGARSLGEVAGLQWTFECTGAFYRCVTIRAAGSDDTVAEFTPHLNGGGIVAFASGARYCWNRQHPWSSRWCFRCAEHKSMLCVLQEAGPLQAGAKVTICADALHRPEAPVLVLLAWYLRVLEFEKLTESVFLCG